MVPGEAPIWHLFLLPKQIKFIFTSKLSIIFADGTMSII